VEAILRRHALDFAIDWTLGAKPFLSRHGRLADIVLDVAKRRTGRAGELSTTGGTSDARFIIDICPEVIEIGPVNLSIHKLNEHIALEELEMLPLIYLDTLRALLREGDVFSQSFRPGTLAARGFSPEEAARIRPGIVYVTLSAWGTEGPWKDRRGFDSIVQTVSGMAYRQSGESKPKLLPVSVIDYVSGYLMAFGALVALARRATEGGSWLVRVSLARTGKWIIDRGVVDDFASASPELSDEELKKLLIKTQSYTHLKPVLELSETPPYWERPPVPLGTHKPEWPTRSFRPGA